jgi:hypothetical protein
MKHEQHSFVSYVNRVMKKKSSLCPGLLGRLMYYKKCKEANNPKVQMELEKDPHYRYFVKS